MYLQIGSSGFVDEHPLRGCSSQFPAQGTKLVADVGPVAETAITADSPAAHLSTHAAPRAGGSAAEQGQAAGAAGAPRRTACKGRQHGPRPQRLQCHELLIRALLATIRLKLQGPWSPLSWVHTASNIHRLAQESVSFRKDYVQGSGEQAATCSCKCTTYKTSTHKKI